MAGRCPEFEKLTRSAALAVLSAISIASCGGPTEPEKKTTAQLMVEDAQRLCAELTAAGITTACNVKAQGMTVDIQIDSNAAEVRKVCADVVESTAPKIGSFRGRWQLRIFPPFSTERPTASCVLK